MVEKKKVLICVLAVDGIGQMDLAEMAFEAGDLKNNPDHPFTYGFSRGENMKPAELAWNSACQTMLDNGYDYLMFWDHDQEPPHNWHWILRLIDSDESYGVAVGDTLMWRPDFPINHRLCHIQILETSDHYEFLRGPLDPGNPFILQGAVGQGAGMVIRRKVLETLGKNWFERSFHDNGVRKNGADINFCRKVRDAGFKVVVDPRVKIEHKKTIGLFEVEEYCQARIKEALEDRESTESQRNLSPVEENLPGVCV